MDHSRSHDPSLDDSLTVADTTPQPAPEPTPDAGGPGRAAEDEPRPGGPRRPGHAEDRLAGLDGESLQRLAVTLPTIEQAKGMLMGYYGISADAAFALLGRWSSERHVKLREVSRLLVERASTPDPQPFGALRRVLDPGEDGQG